MNCAIHDILFWNNNIHFVFFFLFSSMPLSRSCSEVKVARFWNTKQNCGNSGNSQLWHRGCCHNINNANSDYLTPSKKAIEAGIKMLGMDEIVPKAKPISHLLIVSHSELFFKFVKSTASGDSQSRDRPSVRARR